MLVDSLVSEYQRSQGSQGGCQGTCQELSVKLVALGGLKVSGRWRLEGGSVSKEGIGIKEENCARNKTKLKYGKKESKQGSV